MLMGRNENLFVLIKRVVAWTRGSDAWRATHSPRQLTDSARLWLDESSVSGTFH